MVSAVEARHHALLLASGTWLVSLVIVFGGSGHTSVLGKLVGPDFVHFYTFGHFAREGRIAEAYDWQAARMKEGWYRRIDALLDTAQHERFVALVERGLFNEGLTFTIEPGMTVLE